MKFEIITNPSTDIFLNLVKSSKEFLFASPFVKANVTSMIFDNKDANARISLLTSFKLTNFYRNASDLTALKQFIENHAIVRNYSRLHAKIYIFDSIHAIVTSANLTLGGLKNNYECGILVSDSGIVSQLKSNFLEIFEDSENSPDVTQEIIETTENILSKVPTEKKVRFEQSERDLFPEPVDDLYDAGIETIRSSLSGWRKDVFNVVCQISPNIFNLKEAYVYKNELKKLHPENRNVEAKIRQQLQELRDLGLIEFIDKGIYRKLWKDVSP